jgi:hypothetical protein
MTLLLLRKIVPQEAFFFQWIQNGMLHPAVIKSGKFKLYSWASKTLAQDSVSIFPSTFGYDNNIKF